MALTQLAGMVRAMIAELGHFTLILALAIALVQGTLPLVGAQKGWTSWMALAPAAATLQFICIAISFAALTHAFVTSDFSLKLVYENSHTLKPMLYKVSGVWGNHEGSMLLWVLILALFGGAAAWFGGALPDRLRARVLAVQGLIGVAFLAFIIFTSNPFLRLAEPPFNGQDLNPLLQDPGLAFHPPFLYLGYVGLSMAFSFAVAALIEGRVDAAWARWVRPWTLAAWMFLTIGIALGSWWAYYELGWGGFWFWDPVENASFMPWLVATALLHSAIVVEKREALKAWTILLAIIAFGFSLIGTFIVRSGVITSVHAFANDPERGVFILAILAIFVGGALTLYAFRAGVMEAKGVFGLVSRESALVMNNVLLAVAAFVVFVGTIWPLVAELAFVRKLSVGAPFFEAAFTPFMVLLAVLLPIGSLMPWKRARAGRVLRSLAPAALLAFALAALTWAVGTGRPILAPLGVALGVWLMAGAAIDLWTRAGRKAGRLARLPRAGRAARIAEAAAQAELQPADLAKYPVELSGGMRQRVAIARALAVRPDFIFFDEPFTALDVALRRRMQDLVIATCAGAGLSGLFITHDLNEAARIAHRVAVLDTYGGGILGDRPLPGRPGGRSDSQVQDWVTAALDRDPLFRHIHDVDERQIA